MNELPGNNWPEKLGGGFIGFPRGVLALGDLIDDGDKTGQTDIEWLHFEEQFGLDGTDGLLRFPVFEGWGNHDGPPEKFIKQRVSVQRQIRWRNQRRLDQQLIPQVSERIALRLGLEWNPFYSSQSLSRQPSKPPRSVLASMARSPGCFKFHQRKPRAFGWHYGTASDHYGPLRIRYRLVGNRRLGGFL